MSLDKEAVRLAYLSKANKRADERMLNVPQSEVQEGTKYAGGRRGLSSQMPRSRKARKFLTKGRDLILDTAPDILDKIPFVPDEIKKGAKALRFAKRAITGGSHKDRYDVEEDIHITTGGERLKRVKGRGVKEALSKADKVLKKAEKELGAIDLKRKRKASKKKVLKSVKGDEGFDMEMFEMSGRGMKRMVGGAKKRKSAEKMGQMYGKEVVAMDDDVKELVGSGFFEDFGRGFMKGLRMVSGVAKKVLPIVAPGVGNVASAGLSAVGLGNKREYSGGGELTEGDKKEVKEMVEMYNELPKSIQSKIKKGQMPTERSMKGGARKMCGSGATGGSLKDMFDTVKAVASFFGGMRPSTRGKFLNPFNKKPLTAEERSDLFRQMRGRGVGEMSGGAGLPDDLAFTEAFETNRTRSGGAKRRQGTEMEGRHSRKGGAKRPQSEKMKKRNALVRKLMKEEGMTLPQASKHIKEHNLM